MADSTTLVVLIACVGIFTGGLVKGVSGVALPIVTLAILSNFLPGLVVLGLLTVPIVVTNFWQVAVSGPVRPEIRRFWMEIVAICTCLVFSAGYVTTVDSRILYLVIALVVLVFVVTSVAVRMPTIPPGLEKPVGVTTAAVSGLTGGLTTIWGPTMVMYLSSLGLDKDRYVRVIGLIWFCASIPLTIMYVRNGVLNGDNVYISTLMCVPAIAGMVVGKLIRNQLNQGAFQKVVLVILLISALNILRRAFT